MAALEARGVAFEDPDASSFQGREGVVAGHVTDYGPVKSAWFRDSRGTCSRSTRSSGEWHQ